MLKQRHFNQEASVVPDYGASLRNLSESLQEPVGGGHCDFELQRLQDVHLHLEDLFPRVGIVGNKYEI